MTREELLQIAKPILFNTDMVRAILDGRKTVTRRVVKLKYDNTHHEMKTDKYGTRLIEIENDIEGETFGKREDGTTWRRIRGYIEPKAPYKKGDILYVRETWNISNSFEDGDLINEVTFIYRAGKSEEESDRTISFSDDAYGKYVEMMYGNIPEWRPSIHMPKEAARIFLKVTDVRVERLQDMEENDAFAEGIDPWDDRCYANNGWEPTLCDPDSGGDCCPLDAFKDIWNSTIKKSDIERYGWEANPYVWRIEFERLDV